MFWTLHLAAAIAALLLAYGCYCAGSCRGYREGTATLDEWIDRWREERSLVAALRGCAPRIMTRAPEDRVDGSR